MGGGGYAGLISSSSKTDDVSFKSKIIKRANDERDKKAILAFLIIAFNETDAQIVKVFKDQDYFVALDSISGSVLSFYCLAAHDSRFENSKFIPVSRKEYDAFKMEFKISEVEQFPFLYFFQVDENSIIRKRTIKLRAKQPDLLFNEMCEYIRPVADVLNRYNPQGKHQHNEIFELIDVELRSVLLRKKVVKIVKYVPFIDKLLKWL